jgi:hypothetical protein
MRVDELERALEQARDDQPRGDVIAARRVVDGRVRRARVGRAVAVCTAVLLLGMGVAMAARGNDSHEVVSANGGLPHLLPSPMPEGEAVVFDAPTGFQRQDANRATYVEVVWTDDPSDLPTPSSRVLRLSVHDLPDIALPPSEPADPIESSGSISTHWVENGRWIGLSGYPVDRALFDRALAAARVSATGELSFVGLEGFRQVARAVHDQTAPSQSLMTAGMNADLLLGGEPGYAVAFGDRADQFRPSMVVRRVGKSEAWLRYPLLTRERVEMVRGRMAYREAVLEGDPVTVTATCGEAADGDSMECTPEGAYERAASMLTWWEQEDLQVVVTAHTPEEARAIAESLVEVSDAEWAAFLSAATPAEVLTMPTTTTVP